MASGERLESYLDQEKHEEPVSELLEVRQAMVRVSEKGVGPSCECLRECKREIQLTRFALGRKKRRRGRRTAICMFRWEKFPHVRSAGLSHLYGRNDWNSAVVGRSGGLGGEVARGEVGRGLWGALLPPEEEREREASSIDIRFDFGTAVGMPGAKS